MCIRDSYTAVRWVMQLYGVEDERELLEDLQVIEARVIEKVNDRQG